MTDFAQNHSRLLSFGLFLPLFPLSFQVLLACKSCAILVDRMLIEFLIDMFFWSLVLCLDSSMCYSVPSFQWFGNCLLIRFGRILSEIYSSLFLFLISFPFSGCFPRLFVRLCSLYFLPRLCFYETMTYCIIVIYYIEEVGWVEFLNSFSHLLEKKRKSSPISLNDGVLMWLFWLWKPHICSLFCEEVCKLWDIELNVCVDVCREVAWKFIEYFFQLFHYGSHYHVRECFTNSVSGIDIDDSKDVFVVVIRKSVIYHDIDSDTLEWMVSIDVVELIRSLLVVKFIWFLLFKEFSNIVVWCWMFSSLTLSQNFFRDSKPLFGL